MSSEGFSDGLMANFLPKRHACKERSWNEDIFDDHEVEHEVEHMFLC